MMVLKEIVVYDVAERRSKGEIEAVKKKAEVYEEAELGGQPEVLVLSSDDEEVEEEKEDAATLSFLKVESDDEGPVAPLTKKNRRVIDSEDEKEDYRPFFSDEDLSQYESSFIDDEFELIRPDKGAKNSDSEGEDDSLTQLLEKWHIDKQSQKKIKHPMVTSHLLPEGTDPQSKLLAKDRDSLTRHALDQFIKHVFSPHAGEDKLPNITFRWSKTLRTSAGTARSKKVLHSDGSIAYACRIDLAIKVLDAPEKLIDTLAHELCHMATYCISKNYKDIHGPVFRKWMSCVRQKYPFIDMKTKHSYHIKFKYMWRCTRCCATFQRHSNSIDVDKECPRCRPDGQYTLVRLDHCGNPMPKTTRSPTRWQSYLQEHLSKVRAEYGYSHAEAVRHVATMYKEEFSDQTTPEETLESP